MNKSLDVKGCEHTESIAGECGCSASSCGANIKEHGESSYNQPSGCGCGCDSTFDLSHSGEHTGTGEPELPYTKQAIVIGILIAALAYLPVLSGISFALICAGTILIGYPMLIKGLKNLTRLSFDELSLFTIAVSAALIIGEAPEALMVTILFRIGEWLEESAVAKSKREIEALTAIRPDSANLIEPDGSVREIPAREVASGSDIMIRPGERVPLDCEVIKGQSFIDTSAITGEPLPRSVGVGDTLSSGAINVDGLLYCRTIRSFETSAASRIIRMVEESQEQKGRAETLISRFAKIYTPIVMLLAAAIAFLPPLFGMGPLNVWIMRSLVFLVASCPCAFVIAIPLTFFSGVGAASRIGVLVKGTRFIETLAKTDCVAFDKTGTLTYGKPSVGEVLCAPGIEKSEVLETASLAEQYSTHPAAKAVIAYAGGAKPAPVDGFSEIAGMGVSLNLPEAQILCGSKKLMDLRGIDTSSLPAAEIYVAKNGKAIGGITLVDELRESSEKAVIELKKLGCNLFMLSGDAKKRADAIAEKLGIGNVRADLLPGDKVSEFGKIKETNKISLYVGDGINDAPTLALADAGVAMGLGTDTAIEAADVVLMGEKLEQLPAAIKLSRKVMMIARFNIVFALAVKAAVLLAGALGFATMWMAVFADVGVSVICILAAIAPLANSGKQKQ